MSFSLFFFLFFQRTSGRKQTLRPALPKSALQCEQYCESPRLLFFFDIVILFILKQNGRIQLEIPFVSFILIDAIINYRVVYCSFHSYLSYSQTTHVDRSHKSSSYQFHLNHEDLDTITHEHVVLQQIILEIFLPYLRTVGCVISLADHPLWSPILRDSGAYKKRCKICVQLRKDWHFYKAFWYMLQMKCKKHILLPVNIQCAFLVFHTLQPL